MADAAPAPAPAAGGDAKPKKETAGGDAKPKKEKKAPPEGLVIPPKKPKMTKAERRALQEAQRAAKAAAGGAKGGGGGKGKGGGKGGDGKAAAAEGKKGGGGGKSKADGKGESGASSDGGGQEKIDPSMDKRLPAFAHLPQYKDPKHFEKEFSGVALGASASSTKQQFHPAILSLGMQYASGTIRGGNARAKAMLRAFQQVIRDYEPSSSSSSSSNTAAPTGGRPPTARSAQKDDIRHDLDHRIIKPAFQYWTTQCRPHSVSMGNAFTFLKLAVAALDRDMSLEEVKEVLVETIDAYIHERIDVADEAISKHASSKIVDGDVILTYGCSAVVEVLLLEAAKEKGVDSFRVIVVDSRPLLEGRALVGRLAETGIECTYILLNALSYVMMREVTKVFLGASALMSDGSVLSRVGTAGVALMARSNNVPVLVCCETYKISNRVQLESITGNELGNPDDVVSAGCAVDGEGEGSSSDSQQNSSIISDWRTVPNLKVMNLLYDLTPSEFVSGIVTEMGILPATSVAVLLREMNPQDTNTAFMGDL